METAGASWVDLVCSRLADDVAFSWFAVLVVDPLTDQLRIVADRIRNLPNPSVPPERPVVPLDGSLAGSVLRSAAPALVDDAWQMVDEPLAPPEVRSMVAVPVVRDGVPLGVVAVGNPRPAGLGIRDLDRLVAAVDEACAGSAHQVAGPG